MELKNKGCSSFVDADNLTDLTQLFRFATWRLEKVRHGHLLMGKGRNIAKSERKDIRDTHIYIYIYNIFVDSRQTSYLFRQQGPLGPTQSPRRNSCRGNLSVHFSICVQPNWSLIWYPQRMFTPLFPRIIYLPWFPLAYIYIIL